MRPHFRIFSNGIKNLPTALSVGYRTVQLIARHSLFVYFKIKELAKAAAGNQKYSESNVSLAGNWVFQCAIFQPTYLCVQPATELLFSVHQCLMFILIFPKICVFYSQWYGIENGIFSISFLFFIILQG